MFKLAPVQYLENQEKVKDYATSLICDASIPEFHETFLIVNNLLFKEDKRGYEINHLAGLYRHSDAIDQIYHIQFPSIKKVPTLCEALSEKVKTLFNDSALNKKDALLWATIYASMIHPTTDGTTRTSVNTYFTYQSLFNNTLSFANLQKGIRLSSNIKKQRTEEHMRVMEKHKLGIVHESHLFYNNKANPITIADAILKEIEHCNKQNILTHMQ